MQKLTPAQLQFLKGLKQRPQTAVDYYKPAQALKELGFATSAEGKYSKRYEITPAGLDYLEKLEGKA